MNIYVFANCHGVRYAEIIRNKSKIDLLTVEHDTSYANLKNFDSIKQKIRNADVLILQPITSYPEFSVENIKRHTKVDCLIIRIPFVRFWGFWPDVECVELTKFSEESVMFFPKLVTTMSLDNYLTGPILKEEIVGHFDNEVEKLRRLEATGDIPFVDHFLECFQKTPMFNDPYHPTIPFINYLTNKIIEKIIIEKQVDVDFVPLSQAHKMKENVYFRPIRDSVAEELGLEFNLDQYFKYDRLNYLDKIYAHENDNKKTKFIHDRATMFTSVFE
jgi:hypothetical protein